MATTYAIPDGRVAMAATTYTGNGTSQAVSNAVNGVSMQPDFVWTKTRNAASSHRLTDSVRGVSLVLYSDGTYAEGTEAQGLLSFNTNGYTAGTGSSNQNGTTYVGWQWKAGGTAVSNTAGILTSQVSANTTAGFSVCTYTAPASSQANSFGHGLGVAPSMVIAKNRSSGTGGLGWAVYHTSLGANQYLSLNSTAAASTSSGYWGSGMTSTVVGLPTAASSTGYDNCTGNMVAYCFASIDGYSKAFSYTGNGSSDGVFVYLGFRARWLLIKETGNANSWELFDTSRDPYNISSQRLFPNDSAAEATTASLDILSNGIKFRVGNTGINRSGGTYIGFAVAENPFKFANAR